MFMFFKLFIMTQRVGSVVFGASFDLLDLRHAQGSQQHVGDDVRIQLHLSVRPELPDWGATVPREAVAVDP